MTSSSEDTEITLGTGKLLGLFFFLVGVCALFFGLGYSLGRKAEPSTASAATSPATPAASASNKASTPTSSSAAPPMTFYKAVEQKDASPDLTPATQTKPDTAAAPATTAPPAQTPPANPGDPTTTLPTGGYLVQVAAVIKQEDADSLVDALKKKDYPAFVAAPSPNDKFLRVQIGPYSDIKEAEAIRARLIVDGYNPIVKK